MIKSITVFAAIMISCMHISVIQPKDIIREQWEQMTYEEQLEADVAVKAYIAGMSEEDFIFISSVTEAESDRTEQITGKMLIALTIINRVESDDWPDSIYGVLTQYNQFTTVSNGQSCTNRTDTSDLAVIKAVEWCNTGTAPDIQFFNCVGYNNLYPYCESYGNYFMFGSEPEHPYTPSSDT